MKYYTWAEIRAKVQKETDIQDEVFIEPAELIEYVNEAIDEAEAEIHALYEDYFLSYSDVPIVAQDTELDMPADIYANKIRRIVFTSTGGSVYTVNRVKDWHKFEEKALADTYGTTDLLQFFIANKVAGAPKIMLVPKASEGGTVRVWYLRNANRIEDDADICDIPEFINYIFAHMKVKIYEKEGHPGYEAALVKLQTERMRMQGVLAQMVPDDKNEIEMDMSHYEEFN